jgi:hypothetical protein
VGQAHPLKDHPISVAEIQEPPTFTTWQRPC